MPTESTTNTARARRGFTIAEVLIAMSIMLVLIGMSTKLFQKQSRSVAQQAGRLDAQQNSRFALSMLDRELRVAGVGVVDAQPLLVQAAPLAITFNADLVALDTGDKGAVYINPDADSASVDVLRNTNKITLPTSAKLYPDSTYTAAAGVPSNAETISYWLSHDSTSSHSNEYILFRRVNAQPIKVVAHGIIVNPTDTIFQYFKLDSLGVLRPITTATLPIVHTAAMHASTADTGKSALADSIKLVKVQFTSVFHDPRSGQDVFRRMQTTVHLMNAGLIRHATCGQPPLGVTPTAVVTPANGTTIPQTYVTVTWAASVDDATGEKDVDRYAIFRRLSSVSTFDEPVTSIPAGAANYTFTDADLISGQHWIYGVAAQDCTPASSPIGSTAAVVIP